MGLSPSGSAARVASLLLAAFATFVSPERADARDEATSIATAERVVSIGGSITEIIYALGLDDRLVARDSTSIYPPEATELPDVGYMRQLSPEGVLSVEPDAILALEGSGPPETVEVLRQADIPFVTIPETFDRAGVVTKIREVGTALGAKEPAGTLAASIEAELLAAEQATADIADRKRVLFILSIQDGRILASGRGTAADGIIAMAGGVNAVTDYEGYKQLTNEALLAAAPDAILMMRRGGELDLENADLLANAALAASPAGREENIIRMDASYLLGFGPRTAAAVRDLAEALYGASALN